MKKILIVNASKRRIGNSYTLEKRFVELLEGKAEVTSFHIGERMSAHVLPVTPARDSTPRTASRRMTSLR